VDYRHTNKKTFSLPSNKDGRKQSKQNNLSKRVLEGNDLGGNFRGDRPLRGERGPVEKMVSRKDDL